MVPVGSSGRETHILRAVSRETLNKGLNVSNSGIFIEDHII